MKREARGAAAFGPRLGPARGFVALGLVSLAGCARESAPSFIIAGAYFPAWMACALGGILLALALRLILGALRVDRLIALRLPFYAAAAALAGAASWLIGFGS